MSFSMRLWAMTIISFSAFTAWIFISDNLMHGLGIDAYHLVIAATTWLFGIAGTLLINRLHRRAEHLAEQAARNDTIVQLAGGVAHELNQPLTIVISTAELLARRDPAKEDLQPYLQQMVQSALRMSDIVQKLEKATSFRSKPYAAGISIVDLDQSTIEKGEGLTPRL